MHLRVGGGTSWWFRASSYLLGASPRGRRNPRPRDRDGPADGCISAWAEEPQRRIHVTATPAVHLRVGGGTVHARLERRRARGASPRGRRNPGLPSADDRRLGCISAWAEEPQPRGPRRRTRRVHLRVGGGTRRDASNPERARGASPRGRRNPLHDPQHAGRRRCISAWAEEPSSPAPTSTMCWVHLRVGGGTAPSDPRGCHSTGASPRGRRNPRGGTGRARVQRCISAWAEEPRTPTRRRPPPRVHLRVGGGTRATGTTPASMRGASPRGRRNPPRTVSRTVEHRCISAWAEEPRAPRATRRSRRVHLRVGGGTAPLPAHRSQSRGASPRGRRNRVGRRGRRVHAGCISAWAEEPTTRRASSMRGRVHLRVGGGTAATRVPASRPSGASPRGRRNHPLRAPIAPASRCISAWAEEPRSARPRPSRLTVHLRVGGGTRARTRSLTARSGASPRGRRNRRRERARAAGVGCISAWAEEP